MTDQINPEHSPTIVEQLIDFVKVRFWSLIAVAAIAIVGAALLEYELSVPRWIKILGLTGAFLSPVGYIAGNKIVSLLWDPNHIYLVDLDAREVDGALYRFPFEDFRDLDVQNGNLCQLTSNLYTGKAVDLETMTATGTWRGTLDDRDLLRSLNKVREVRGTLEQDARRGFVLDTQAWQIVRAAVRRTTEHIVDTFESGTLPDRGEALGAEVDKALEEFNLEKEIEDELIENDPSIEEVSQETPEESTGETSSDPFTNPQPEAADD